MANEIRIISQNVRGLGNYSKRLKLFNYYSAKSDIVMFQETHSIKQTNVEWSNNLSEWEILFSNGKSNSRGVCTAFKRNIGVNIICDINSVNGQFLITECKLNDLKVFLINIYAPSTSLEKDYLSFLSNFKQNLEQAYDNMSPIVMGGDFNYIFDYDKDRKGGNVKKWDKCKKVFNDIINTYGLIDIWRIRNPTKQSFTWRRRNPTPIQSRLDYWLVSESLEGLITDCGISPGINSDHSAINIAIANNTHKGPSLWKFNNLLLEDNNYIVHMKAVITANIREMTTTGTDMSAQARWEFLKYKIKQHSREYSIKQAKHRKKEQADLEREIQRLENDLSSTNFDSDHNKLAECKRKLDELLDIKTKNIIFQSKTTIYEEDEKNTKYFLNLINYNKNKSSIMSLKNSNKPHEIIKGRKQIMDTIQNFYTDLYSAVETNIGSIHAAHLVQDLPQLSDQDRTMLDRELTENELHDTLKTFANGKCPGNDGLSAEFYLKFWDDIKACLVECMKENISLGEMSSSQKQSVISLLEKEGKDKMYLKNWRPISLINVDAKLFSKLLAIRLKKIVNKLIKDEQVAYVNDRFIGDGIRLIYDMIELTSNNNMEGFLAAIDFEKAFDSIGWDYMYFTLRSFGFSEQFISYIKTLYSGIESCVMNNGTTTKYFPISKGVRQGDPLSPYLFILSIEPLAVMIRNNMQIEGIKLGNKDIKLSLYADDLSIFLKNLASLKELKKTLKLFNNISGLKYNCEKTEILPLGRCTTPSDTLGLIWKDKKIKILGVIFNKVEIVDQENYSIILNKLKNKLNMWKMRGLSLIGKIQIIKAYGVSQILYITNMVGCSQEFLNEVNRIIFGFLWNGKDKIKRRVMVADYNNGGLKMIDLESTIKTQRIMWMKRYLESYSHPWKIYLKYHINKLGGESILFGGVEIGKNNMPTFYRNCINDTNKYIDANLDDFPHTKFHQSIWHNKTVSFAKNGMHLKHLSRFGINQIRDVFNSSGNLKKWNELQGAPSALFLEWYGCINAMAKAKIKHCPDINNLCPNAMITDKILTLKHKQVYKYFVEDIVSERPTNELKLIGKYGFENMEYVYTLPFNVCINSKLRAFQYRCIHDIIYLNDRLVKMKLIEGDKCSFCNISKETPTHFFVDCSIAIDLWRNVQQYFDVFAEYGIAILREKDIMYGVFIEDFAQPKVKLMNHLIIMCKKYLYNCRMLNSKPNFNQFLSNVIQTKNIEYQIAKKRHKLNIHCEKWHFNL